ncbi:MULTISPECIES: iron-containing alcohol dehydrogenase family protein [unclassified Mycolicibacterium]|uniref:iron-containing alcohol dehydrogenase family protein n=1 Tax=unclassified Mycolicibacterium TaxID=2636767 RepID=UPI001305A68E|nr:MULTISPECIES: iron-containing alcohol dehydrogenase [unclassified Mycolicibacterium]MUL82537.1 iron-containing alcohol dehydrogenase [Mycolicibacterium sp. CBMA 329]MUL91331.1 iron-containing alcohol dehydrogenase [Mycolicibacterium sp. CBMA 331]MUM01454.1 iron-containing alcohol dehydrogenase [Mycolicibacterium sp. CBMA 334]MUM29645.1 iron-containing alcohol dehydrogenase [Mycolicibacterium sp. CBMA 295]MUM41755.1 iron-containing alcohol dehydrogenase [Mycolicibacterium sp. CBMA 247]
MTEQSITPFNNHLPVRISFGEGKSHELPDLLGAAGAGRVLVLTDENIDAHNPAVADLLATLMASGLDITRMDKPAGEPTIDMVDAATAGMARAGAEAVVAIGGGSVIDTAKAARLCYQNGLSFAQFLDSPREFAEPSVPLFAVPTTAGTGSEVSGGAVVSEPVAGRKAGIAHPNLRAQYAVVDPVLTWSMPPAMTANTGIDALAQAIAAIVAKVHTPIGDAIALEAVRLMCTSLLTAYRDGTDAVARSNMSCGSMLAGLAMNISDCAAEHSLGQAIGGLTGVPHGLTIGLVLAETLERERHFVPTALERVADAWGLPDDGTRDGSRVVAAVRSLLADLKFPVLTDIGLSETDLDRLTDLALADYFITMAPEPWQRDEVHDLFAAALSLSGRELTTAQG